MATFRVLDRARTPMGGSQDRRPSRWWLDRSVRVKGMIVVAVPMFALVAMATASLVFQQQESAERQVAMRANGVVRATQAVLADALDAETNVRGYAASTDPAFLPRYFAAVTRLGTDVQLLSKSATTARQTVQAAAISETVTAEISQLADLRTAVLAGNVGAALAPTLAAGKVVMDRLRAQTAVLADEPTRVVSQKRDAINRLEKVIQLVEVTGLASGMLAGLLGIALFTSGISRRVRVAADNAGRLGRGEALLPAKASADELGELGESLTRAHQVMDTRLAELSTVRDQALLATQTKTTFLSRTSHELRTPLNAILGFAQLLEMSELDEDDRDSTDRILTAGRHLLALINELIDVARVESGELKLSVEPIALHRVTEEVASLMGPLATARGITIEHRSAGPTFAAYADHQRLRQIIVNLASNAVKYNHHGGMIRIGYQLVGSDQVEVTVTDTGPGLSAEEIERIFVPFERLDADQHGIEGTGIGLPLALALTEAMHGTLNVTSAPGYGSTFTIRLPRAPDIDIDGPATDITNPSTDRPDAAAMDTFVVLSIEDNTANSELLARLFRSWPGTTLHTAGSANVGLDLACRHHPDLILLDLHLPDMPGEEVLAQLQAEPATATTPIVILSADATPGTIRRLLARGAAAYLTKQLDLRELQDLLTTASATRASAKKGQPHR
jgi:signal transduction histidine kinase/ActR/RegA family two-component response regulator